MGRRWRSTSRNSRRWWPRRLTWGRRRPRHRARGARALRLAKALIGVAEANALAAGPIVGIVREV